MHRHRRDLPGQNVANRIDIHPWAIERLRSAERIYFALEGTPKADAILTRIIATGESASVINVPSVTLWRAPELKRFAKDWLAGSESDAPLVVIVADADHHENPRVVRQALLLRERLDGYGVSACVAAPPDHRDSNGQLLHKGVDDFLVAGGDLDDLQVLHRTAWFSLALYADEEGKVRAVPATLATLLGCRRDPEYVCDLLGRYRAAGMIAIDGSLDLKRDDWSGGFGWKGPRNTWPTLTVCPEWRYAQRFVRLGDHSQLSWTLADEVLRQAFVAGAEDDRFPNARHLAEGVKRAAAKYGLESKTVRDDPRVRDMRRTYLSARDMLVRHQVRVGEPVERWGSSKQISRIVRGAE
jgi:hypothetical protein